MKKIISLCLTLIMLLSCLSIGAFADGAENVASREASASKWNGTVYAEGNYTFDGEGTNVSPYLLKSADDVAKLASNVIKGTSYKGKYIKLECDLDLDNKEWVGIGMGSDDTNRFEGTFDGDCHVIYNFNLENAGYNGFFGYVGNGAVIKNIGIASGSATLSNNRSGALIGFAKLNVTVENCFNMADMTFNAQECVGGLIGAIMNDAGAVHRIVNCYNAGNVTLNSPAGITTNPNYAVGGLVGYFTDGANTVENCYNTGNISVNSYGTAGSNVNYAVAGLVGVNAWGVGPTVYTNCANSGTVSVTYSDGGTLPVNVGAILGFANKAANVSIDNTNKYTNTNIGAVGTSEDNYLVSAAVPADTVTLPLENGLFLKSIAQDSGSQDEGNTKKDTYTPANDAEKARYEAASKWDGSVYSVTKDSEIYTFEGNGTKSSPYLLNSASDVAKLAANVRYTSEDTNYLGKYFKLTCDIDLQNKEWLGIGGCFGGVRWCADPKSVPDKTLWDYEMFSGTFDGDGHVIYNFNLADETQDGSAITANGFFGYAGYATITNLGIVNGNVEMTNASRIGALIGASRHDLTLENCFNRANLTFKYTASGTEIRVGGLMGAVMNDASTFREITDCYNSGNITVVVDCDKKEHNVGGIAGYLSDGAGNDFVNCCNTGNISVTAKYSGTADKYRIGIGSLVGSFAFKGNYSFKNCAAGGTVTYTNENGGTALIGAYVGYVNDNSTLDFHEGNTYSVSTEQIVGEFIGGDPDNVAKVSSVNVSLADIYFMSSLNTDDGGADDGNNGNGNNGNGNTDNGDSSNNNGDNAANNNGSETTDTAKNDGTTEAQADTEEEKKSGCGSAVGSIGMAALVTVGIAFTAVSAKNKKED